MYTAHLLWRDVSLCNLTADSQPPCAPKNNPEYTWQHQLVTPVMMNRHLEHIPPSSSLKLGASTLLISLINLLQNVTAFAELEFET